MVGQSDSGGSLIDFLLRLTAAVHRRLAKFGLNRSVSSIERERIRGNSGNGYFAGKAGLFNVRSIVVTTFSERFDLFCLPLVEKLSESAPEYPIYVVINADWDKAFHPRIRSEFIGKLARIPNCFPICLGAPSGMARIWNVGLKAANSEATLILGDDTFIDSESIRESIDLIFNAIESHDFVVINGSFGHFGMTRSCLAQVGAFDERFLGFGEEDGDYYWRFEHIYNKPPKHLDNFLGLENLVDVSGHSAFPSPSGLSKYSLFNSIFIKHKYRFGTGTVRGMFDSPAEKVIDEPSDREIEAWGLELRDQMFELDEVKIAKRISDFLEKPRLV
jgi:hypothetical protein